MYIASSNVLPETCAVFKRSEPARSHLLVNKRKLLSITVKLKTRKYQPGVGKGAEDVRQAELASKEKEDSYE